MRQSGVSVIEEKRLMSFLADNRAFDNCPAVREVMKAIATGDYGKELYRFAIEKGPSFFLCFR